MENVFFGVDWQAANRYYRAFTQQLLHHLWLERPRPWADGVSFSPCRHGWQWADAGGPVVLSPPLIGPSVSRLLSITRALNRERERERSSELLFTVCLIPRALCDYTAPFLYAASMKQGHIPKCWASKNVKREKQACCRPGVNKLAKLFPLPRVPPRPPLTLLFKHSFKVAAQTSWTLGWF